MSPGAAFAWRPRAAPLEPVAAILIGAAAAEAARRLIAGWAGYPAEARRGWRGVGSSGGAVGGAAGGAVGEAWIGLIGADLPWCEGAIWLGRDPEAPGLLLPTLRVTDPHPRLLELALPADAPAPVAAIPWPPGLRLLSLAAAQPIDPDHLRRWIGRAAPAAAGAR